MRLTAVAGVGWLAAVSAAGCGAERSHLPDAAPESGPESGMDAPALAADDRAPPHELDPDTDPPPPRDEPQLADAELETVLANARPLVVSHDVSAALLQLNRCANKLPQSGECEALLAIVLLEHRLHRAHAHYYLAEVVAKDHPDVTSEQLRQLARLATSRGRFAEADKALAILEARGDADDEELPGLARLL